jgi:hypothetical protein
VSHRAKLLGERTQKLFGSDLLMNECGGITDQELGKPHRCGHLDLRLRARPPNRDRAGKQHRYQIDRYKDEQKLGPDRAPMPKAAERDPPWKGQTERPTGRSGLRADGLPPSR